MLHITYLLITVEVSICILNKQIEFTALVFNDK